MGDNNPSEYYHPHQGMLMFSALNTNEEISDRDNNTIEAKKEHESRIEKTVVDTPSSTTTTTSVENENATEGVCDPTSSEEVSRGIDGPTTTTMENSIPCLQQMSNLKKQNTSVINVSHKTDGDIVNVKTEPIDDSYTTEPWQQDLNAHQIPASLPFNETKAVKMEPSQGTSSSSTSLNRNKSSGNKGDDSSRFHPQNHEASQNSKDTQKFKCLLCRRTFWSRNSLKRHRQFHISRRPFKCSLCNRSFCRVGLLIRHTKHDKATLSLFKASQVGNRRPYHRRKLGPFTVLIESVRSRHCAYLKRLKKSKEKNTCNVCDMSFSYKRVFRSHKIQSNLLLNSQTMFVMKKNMSCAAVEISNNKLPKQEIDTTVQGIMNGSSYIKPLDPLNKQMVMESVNQQVQVSHWNANYKRRKYTKKLFGEQKTSHVCSVCERNFSQNSALINHMRLHTGEKPHECTLCGKKFSQNSGLNNHMRTHLGVKPFTCTFCQKAFRDSTKLNNHVRTHTGEKPFKCSICDRSFSQSGDLVRHMRVHTGEKPYECHVCGKLFSENSNLNKHLRTHTGDKRFQCSICDKAFTEGSTLTNHMRIHTGDRPYSCSVCAKTFIQSGDLHKHMRTHTGEKPHRCTECERAFTDSSTLKRHFRTKHFHLLESNVVTVTPAVAIETPLCNV